MDKSMDERIAELLANPPEEITRQIPEVLEAQEEKELPPPEIKVEVTKDKMTVFLNAKVYSTDQVITVEDILEKLKEIGVVYGINNELLKDFCENRQFFKSIRAASGLQPTKGKDGFVTFHFRKEISNAPVELEDGTLDFKNMNNIENVSKDDLLCDLTPAQSGVEGIDVLGNPVPATMGKEAVLPNGKNVVLASDGLSLYAAVEGEISYRAGSIVIDDCKVIKTDVGPATGNIEYNGSVIVNGGVMEGFMINATKNITIKGNVEGAKIIAGGNIALLSGINGMSKGVVKSGGDVTAKYVENVTIDCDGNFRTDVAINCIVWSKAAIIIKGKNGAILSGSYMANDFIYVKTVGSENRNNASLMVQSMWYLKSGKDKDKEQQFDVRANARDMAEVQKQLDGVNRAIDTVKSPDSPFKSPMEKSLALKKYIMMKSQINQKSLELQKQLDSFEKGKDKTSLKIICPGTIYPGGKITLDKYGYRVENALINQKLYPEHGEIVSGPILPHEKEIN